MHHKVAEFGKWMSGMLAVMGIAVLAGPALGADGEQAAAGLAPAQVDQARGLFMDWSCGACHALADGEGYGQIGPSFDGNGALERDYVVNRVTNGQGAMPGFGGQLSEEEIALLADYIVQVKK